MRGWESLGSICSGGRTTPWPTTAATSTPASASPWGHARDHPAAGQGRRAREPPHPDGGRRGGGRRAHRRAADRVANQLRARGVAAEVSPTAAKFGKQIRFADRRGVPFVWFPALDDVDVDAATR